MLLFIKGRSQLPRHRSQQLFNYSQVWIWLHMTRRQSHPSVGNSQRSIYPFQHQCPAEIKENVNSLSTGYDNEAFMSNHFQTYPQVACAREVLSVLVEGNCHNTVGGVESLLHTVTMMDVDIYVQNSLVVSGKKGKILKRLIQPM